MKIPKLRMDIPWEEHRRRFELYSQKLDDGEVAKKTYVTKPAIRIWRKRHELPPNKPQGSMVGREPVNNWLSGIKERLRYKLYKMGFIDKKVEYVFGLSNGTMWHWRRKRNLPHNEGLPVINEYETRYYEPDTEEFLNTIMEG